MLNTHRSLCTRVSEPEAAEVASARVWQSLCVTWGPSWTSWVRTSGAKGQDPGF